MFDVEEFIETRLIDKIVSIIMIDVKGELISFIFNERNYSLQGK
jgi:hypothetical protein